MRFKHCPDCGHPLSSRDLGDEKDVPWCDSCGKPWFEIFPSAVIALVHDHDDNVLLLRQGYISTQFCNLVSGYIKPGETAEDTARREIFEETGQAVEELDLVCTNWFAKKEMMMIGFFARVTPSPLRLSSEVDEAFWIPAESAIKLVHPYPTSTSRLLTQLFIDKSERKNILNSV